MFPIKMNLNNKNTRLRDLILLKKNFIPKNLCKYIVDEINGNKWDTHLWYHAEQKEKKLINGTKEPYIQHCSQDLQNLISPYTLRVKDEYENKIAYKNPPTSITQNFSYIRFNKYECGQLMDNHIDHIHSLFTPPNKGIPILSMVINFNEDYEGGELVFWNNIKYKLSTGDIIIWPSVFLFPHKVNEVRKNIRYSGVIWFW